MYKYLIAALLLFSFSFSVVGQTPPAPDTSDFPYWIDMMADPSVNLFQTQRAFNLYWKNKPIDKGSGYKPFKRWEYNMMELIDGKGNIPPPGALATEVEKYMASRKTASPGGIGLLGFPGTAPCLTSGIWVEIGPKKMPKNNTGQPNGLGRVNALAFHPTDSNTIYAGTPAGGLWISTNGGASWSTNTDTLATLGVSSIAIHPQNPDTMYIGTGDRDGSDSYGRGVLKSSDGGKTWVSAKSGMGNTIVGRLIIDPNNAQIILAATSSGIYRSTNSASSWTRTSTGNFRDLVFDAVNSDYVFAAKYATASFWRSTDNGVNWTNITSGLPSGQRRMAIGVTLADSNIIYNLVTESRKFKGLYQSMDRGNTFKLMSDSPNIMDYSHLGSGTGGQAWYDLDIAVDPSDARIIYTAGVNIFQSLDSGKTWKISAHWVGSGGADDVHADNHILEYQKATKTLFTGNDGGVYYTKDRGKNWPEISNGLAVAQIYRIGQSALNPNMLINGYQDNGTGLFYNGAWYTIMGGDGMDCVIDPTDDTWAFSDLYYGDIRRFKNNSYNGIVGKNGVNGINESGGWVTPFIFREGNTNTMFAGYKNVWRSTNIKAPSTSNVSWTKISNNLGGTNSQNIIALENSSADDNILYMSKGGNTFFRTDSANTTSPTWTNLTSSLPNASRVGWIESHRTFKDRLWICQSNKIYQSNNRGGSWTNISSGLPNIPILCLVLDSSSQLQGMYAGTYMGVFYKDTTMSGWIWYNDNMPINTRVRDIEIYYSPSGRSKSHVACGTYGRGNWRSPLYDEDQVVPIAGFTQDHSISCQNESIAFTDTSEKSPTRWLWRISPNTVSFISGTDSSSQNPVVQFNAKGRYTVQMLTANCKGADSITKTAIIDIVDPISSVNCIGITTSIANFGIGVYGVDMAGKSHTSLASEIEGAYVDRACTEIFTIKTDTAYFTTITTGVSYKEYVKVFIDFNNNGSLNDAGEMVFDGPRGQTNHQDSIRIPTIPVLNTLLRMRVMSDFDTIPADACDTLRYGQTEDFGVIIEPRIPIANFGIDTNRICKNGKIILTDSSIGGIYNQRWYVSKYDLLTFKSDSAGPVTFVLPDTGWYYAELVLNDSIVSKRIDSIVYVQPLPSGNLTLSSGSLSSCENGALTFVNQASPSKFITSKWFKRGIEMVGETDTFLALTNLSSTDTGAYYSIIDWNGCFISTDTSVVSVNPIPVADFTPDKTEDCFLNNKFTFTNTSTIVTGSMSYDWSFGDGNTSTATDATVTYSDTGAYRIQLIAISSAGCKDTTEKGVFVWETPVAGFGVNASSQCLNENVFAFTNSSTLSNRTLTYTWSLGDGNNDTGTNVTHSYVSANTYNVQLIVKSNRGCTDTMAQIVDVRPSPTADYVITTFDRCGSGNLFDFTDNSSVGSGAITNFEWDFGDGSTSIQQNELAKTLNGNGLFTIRLVVATNLGCRDTAVQTVTIDAKPVSDFMVAQTVQCFNGHSVALTNQSNISSGNIIAYLWDYNDGNTSTASSPANYQYANPGSYTIQLIVTSDMGCTDTTDVDVVIHPSPEINFDGVDGCVDEVISFVNNSVIASGILSFFNWSFGDGTTSTDFSTTHSYNKSGIYEVKLIVTSDQGCRDSLVNKAGATVYDNPIADFTFQKLSSDGSSTEIEFIDQSTGAISWLWVFDKFGSSGEQNPILTFSDSGTYQIELWVVNSDGCTDSIMKSIFIFPDNLFHMPSSFTPNGDGLNEVIKPIGVGYLRSYRMTVYNRWGIKVFETTESHVGWDGTYQGEFAQLGVYLINVEYTDLNDNKGRKDATVLLIR